MKGLNFIVALIVGLILTVAPVDAASLAWDSPTGTVDGYVVYYGAGDPPAGASLLIARDDETNVGVYNVSGDALRVEDIDTLFSIPPGVPVWFSVSAWNANGESLPCPAVTYTRPAYQPRADRTIAIDAPAAVGEPAGATVQ